MTAREAISREDWDEHVAEDEARGRDINDLKLAMFGDPERPETVKHAVLPTMTRFNTLMDGAVTLVKVMGSSIVVLAAAGGFAKTMGWL